jgi:hypothetical protein
MHAYITTPNFPASIPSNANCECSLHSNYDNGQILLRRIDMKLPSSHCDDGYLEVTELHGVSERKCGYIRDAGSIFGSGSSRLQLTFRTSPKAVQYHDAGFWLEILASPPYENHTIEIVCNQRKAPTPEELKTLNIFRKLKLLQSKIDALNVTSSVRIKLNKFSKFFENKLSNLNETDDKSRPNIEISTNIGVKKPKGPKDTIEKLIDKQLDYVDKIEARQNRKVEDKTVLIKDNSSSLIDLKTIQPQRQKEESKNINIYKEEEEWLKAFNSMNDELKNELNPSTSSSPSPSLNKIVNKIPDEKPHIPSSSSPSGHLIKNDDVKLSPASNSNSNQFVAANAQKQLYGKEDEITNDKNFLHSTTNKTARNSTTGL